MSKLTRDDVLKLASLSKLKLTDEEVDRFTTELSEIINYVDMLDEVDVTGLEPTYQITGLTNVTRPDEVHDYGYKPEELLKNTPAQENNQFKVKRVLN
jgi:aspartyl-tRNA(Asn)/glutamyl-tRNA(Gln) amidotransferase subunit C